LKNKSKSNSPSGKNLVVNAGKTPLHCIIALSYYLYEK
jgi:hypothetical protein